MHVHVLKVEVKDIRTKTGQAMQLRIVHGYTREGDTFRFTLPRGHADITAGPHQVKAEPFVNFDAELGARSSLVPMPSKAAA